MKKMSEVFELPLVVEFVGGTDFHVKNKSRQSPAIYSNSADEAFSAARAINHIDALAEALDALLIAVTTAKKDESINSKIINAARALNAYRGGK